MDLPAIPGLLQFGQAAVYRALRDCAADPAVRALLALDATCGNGRDSLFLAAALRETHAGKNHCLLALDVQRQALDNTAALLQANALLHLARFRQQGHEELAAILDETPEIDGSPAALCAGMYNLGFLPGSDKRIITRAENTLRSLAAAAERLHPGGLLSIHAYGGHPGGLEELEAVEAWCAKLAPAAWTAARYSIHNKTSRPETLFLLQKRFTP